MTYRLQLTTVTFKLWTQVCSLHTLAGHLRSLTYLENLTLDFWFAKRFPEDEYPEFDEEEPIKLPRLRTLSIRLGPTQHTIRKILEILDVENIEELTLKLHLRLQNGALDCAEMFFPPGKPKWTSQQTLSCDIDIEEDEFAFKYAPLNVLLTRLPPIRHLTIEAPNLVQPWVMKVEPSYLRKDVDHRALRIGIPPPLRT